MVAPLYFAKRVPPTIRLNKTHIPDRNRANSTHTLCGRLRTQSAVVHVEESASCLTCRRLYYGEENNG